MSREVRTMLLLKATHRTIVCVRYMTFNSQALKTNLSKPFVNNNLTPMHVVTYQYTESGEINQILILGSSPEVHR